MNSGGFEPLDLPIPGGNVPDQSGTQPQPPVAQQLIDEKHREYLRKSHRYRWLYRITRTSAGLSSGLLPFVVGNWPTIATILSIVIVVAVVVDSVWDPKGRWQLFSQATDLIAIADLKSQGQYEKYKDQLEILLATEAKRVERLVDLEDLLKRIKGTRQP